MRADEFDKDINEAMPMGGLQSIGQKLRSQLPTFDPTGAAQAKGKLESGKLANKLVIDYNQFLGQIRQQATPRNLLQFLTKAGYGTKGAIADLKKNVKPIQAAPGQTVKERAAVRKAPTRKNPVTKPTNLSLVPKDLALEPMEPGATRKDVTDVPTPATPQPKSVAPQAPATKPGQPSIAMVPLNQKQINSALLAAATEYYAGGTATTPSQSGSQQTAPAQPAPKQTGPGIAKSFAAGLQGRSMPSGSSTPVAQIDFDDPRSMNTLVRQMNSFVQGGGKLDPRTKQTLQQLISKL